MDGMMLVSLLLLCLTRVDSFIFPAACITNGGTNMTFPVRCCPFYKGSECGGALNRGSCMPPFSSRFLGLLDVTEDERDDFPIRFFSHVCVCKGKFSGLGCADCVHGWKGEYCNETNIVERRDIQDYSPAEREQYLALLDYCKHKINPDYLIMQAGDRFRSVTYKFKPASYLDGMCFEHFYATQPFILDSEEINWLNFAHGSTAFLPWHRLYLIQLEISLRKCSGNDSAAIAYYNWTNNKECEICNNNFLGESDAEGNIHPHSIFSRWRMVCGGYNFEETSCLMPECECERPKFIRRPAFTAGVSIPTSQEIENCLKLPAVDTSPYDSSSPNSFRNCIERLHNRFHVYIGGTMSKVAISCNDPLFACHHCFIDLLWEEHITRHNHTPNTYPSNTRYGHGPNTCISPLYECRKNKDMMTPCKNLGYTYRKRH